VPQQAAGFPHHPTLHPARLERLVAGMPIVYGGDRVAHVPEDLADAFVAGDRLIVVQECGDLLHVPQADWLLADDAVRDAQAAFLQLGRIDDDAIAAFFAEFAARLADDDAFGAIAAANAQDVASARGRGRSTTRLVLSDSMRAGMIAGLLSWRDTPSRRDALLETVDHGSWRVEQRVAALGVVGFVFEGRPNVFADATGVLCSGNSVVFRIGSDALGTARAIVEHALEPALAAAGLPPGAVRLLDSPSRATGWALFSHPLLSLAVARGSGTAVAQLGAVARQAGVPVSLHGTGGAWLVAGESADPDAFEMCVLHSLDRKVCNTLNVCCVLESAAKELVPRFLFALRAAADRRGTYPKLHVAPGAELFVDGTWFDTLVPVSRAEGDVAEPMAEPLPLEELGREWEWEDSPEVALALVSSVDQAIEWFNRESPRLVATLVSDDSAEQERFWQAIDAPFVGNGFTRWVDGQFALDRPELGLANWQHGRLFARSAVLSGDSVFTVRTRAWQNAPDLHR
jgi:glutamate-5-semialdehyde dehydrogenase